MKPHKDQDGYKYIRTKSYGKDKNGNEVILPGRLAYNDNKESWTRIISSVRVERAVETDDYLRRCQDEGLLALMKGNGWIVGKRGAVWGQDSDCRIIIGPGWGVGPTLREAYGDYRANRAKREREQ